MEPITTILIFIICFGIFLGLRELWCWILKTSKIVELLEKILQELQQMNIKNKDVLEELVELNRPGK